MTASFPMLAASDWTSLLAMLVFVVVSMVAGVLKKKFETRTGQPGEVDADVDADLEEPSPPPRRFAPPPPPTAKAVTRPPMPLRPAPLPARVWIGAHPPQVRVAESILQSIQRDPGKTVPRPQVIQPVQPPSAAAKTAPPAPLARPPWAVGRLRDAVVMAEIIAPPIALRPPDDRF